jgi:hypothetical protein
MASSSEVSHTGFAVDVLQICRDEAFGACTARTMRAVGTGQHLKRLIPRLC